MDSRGSSINKKKTNLTVCENKIRRNEWQANLVNIQKYSVECMIFCLFVVSLDSDISIQYFI